MQSKCSKLRDPIHLEFRITKSVANFTAIRRLANLYLKVEVPCHGTRYNTTWYQTERTYCLVTQPAKQCVACMRHLSQAKGSFDKTVCPRNPAGLIEGQRCINVGLTAECIGKDHCIFNCLAGTHTQIRCHRMCSVSQKDSPSVNPAINRRPIKNVCSYDLVGRSQGQELVNGRVPAGKSPP